ncbi:MAG TPA: hypothetical protein VGC09_04065, partial [Rhodopila sp.]
LPVVSVDADVTVLATFVPDFPIYPPETSWMRQPRTDLPAIAVREGKGGGKLVWFAADIDRCYARDESFEHALLMANAVRWALGNRSLLSVQGGNGFATPCLYRQDGRRIVHINNRLITARVPGRQNELVPVGPVRIGLRLAAGMAPPREVELRVSDRKVPAKMVGDELLFELDQIFDHEVAVIPWPG